MRSAFGTAPARRAPLAPRVAVLLVDRDRVVGLGVDAVGDEKVEQLIAMRRVLRLDHVEMEHVTVPGTADGRSICVAPDKSRGVARRPLDALIVPGVDVLQLGAEHAGVEIVETAVEPVAVDVALGRSRGCAACGPSRRCRRRW